MAGIDKSIKLMFNDFQRSIAEVPLDVYYQTLSSDQYNSNGFQFNIKQPGSNALLDTEMFIEYTFYIAETITGSIAGGFEGATANALGNYTALRADISSDGAKIAFRGGNVMWRAMQNLNLQINNRTINVQPYKFVEELNRIYVSNDQSEHEFSASGGRFDEGNHGTRTKDIQYGVRSPIARANNVNAGLPFKAPYIPDTWQFIAAGNNAATNTTNDNSSKQLVRLSTGFYNEALVHENDPAIIRKDFPCIDLRPEHPATYEWINPGYDRRCSQFAERCRYNWAEEYSVEAQDLNIRYISTDINAITNLVPIANFQQTQMFRAQVLQANTDTGLRFFKITIMERLPIPLFKMYSNDEVFGVIPNIKQMNIQANWVSNMAQQILRSNSNAASVSISFVDSAGTALSNNICKLYLRWYTAPISMAIPRSITIPYKKIVVYSKSIDNLTNPAATMALVGNPAYQDNNNIQEYNITLEAIPDLLLIYFKTNVTSVNYNFVDDDSGHAEIKEITINIDASSGKLNQMKTYDLYLKWKKLMKHSDSKIINYHEWRRHVCIACLLPEDYGVKHGPGYSNQTVLGIMAKIRWWKVNPSVMYANSEPLGNTCQDVELVVTSIYNRNSLTINDNGTCTEELVKIAADFNIPPPM